MPETKVMSPKEFMAMEKKEKEMKQIKAEMKMVAKKEAKELVKKEAAIKKQKKPELKTKVPIEDLIEMRCYIKYNLYYGQTRARIKQALLEHGWTEAEIKKEMAKIKKPHDYSLKKPTKKYFGKFTKAAQSMIPRPVAPKPVEQDIPVPLPPQARK